MRKCAKKNKEKKEDVKQKFRALSRFFRAFSRFKNLRFFVFLIPPCWSNFCRSVQYLLLAFAFGIFACCD
jgi:hypothetical protein